MATGGIPKSTSQYADLIIGENYPPFDENAYAARAGEQHANGKQASQAVATVTNAANTVADNMQGLTADASEAQSAERVAKLTAQGTRFENRALGVAAMGQNIANTKTALNGNVEAFEVAWEQAKVQLVASGADQATLQATYEALVDEFQRQSDSIGANFQQADTELKGQVKAGAEPTIPSSMPAPGSDAPPSLDLPPELMQQMQGMLGQGMGAAQQLPQQLQGALGPLGEQGQQALDKILQAAQGGGSGNVTVTPDMLDEMLSSQGSGSTDSGSGSEPEPKEREPEPEPKEREPEPEPEPKEHDREPAPVPAAPSPAAEPVTAAPPDSATIPETTLSADGALDVLFG